VTAFPNADKIASTSVGDERYPITSLCKRFAKHPELMRLRIVQRTCANNYGRDAPEPSVTIVPTHFRPPEKAPRIVSLWPGLVKWPEGPFPFLLVQKMTLSSKK